MIAAKLPSNNYIQYLLSISGREPEPKASLGCTKNWKCSCSPEHSLGSPEHSIGSTEHLEGSTEHLGSSEHSIWYKYNQCALVSISNARAFQNVQVSISNDHASISNARKSRRL